MVLREVVQHGQGNAAGWLDRLGVGIDRAVGFVSPERGARRMAARLSLELLRRGGYRGARNGRGTHDWLTLDASADEDVIEDLPGLRQRSLDLIKNDGRAAGMHTTMVTSVIGRGINPEPSLDHEALGLSAEQAAQIEKQMARIWRTYFIQHADAGRRMHFNRIQRQAYWMRRAAGEYLVLPKMIRRPGRRLEFCLQTIDPARLDTPPGANRDRVRGGVKLGAYGEPLGYFIRKAHPGEWFGNGEKAQQFEFIPAEDAQGRRLVLHGYDVTRPGQSRGVPAYSCVLSEFSDVGQYREAERFAMRLAACIGLIIKQSSPGAPNQLINVRNGQRVHSFEPDRPDQSYGFSHIFNAFNNRNSIPKMTGVILFVALF